MTGNAAQAEAWNGDNGRHFIAESARHERMLEPHTARLLAAAGIQPADAVLDIGCGCGETTIRAARAARDGYALGADLSAVMLAEARRRAGREQVGNVRFEQADAQTCQFPVAGFDVALSRFGLMFFDDPPAAFANIAAAVRPGGRLAFVCWQEALKVEYFAVPVMAVLPCIPAPELPGAQEPGPFSLASPERIRALLAGAGFREVGIEDLTVPAWIGRDVDDVIGYYRSMPLGRSLLASAGEGAMEQIRRALHDAILPYQRDDGVRLGAAAWLVTAVRS